MGEAAPLAFVDTETTGLEADRHEIWEVAVRVHRGTGIQEKRWMLPVTRLEDADPMGLLIGRFHVRHPQGEEFDARAHPRVRITSALDFALQFRDLTDGCHLAGMVVSFDEERLRRFLRLHGVVPHWHYHLVDVENLIAGWLHLPPPWDSDELSKLVGVNPESFDRHTALGDVKWAEALYDRAMRMGS